MLKKITKHILFLSCLVPFVGFILGYSIGFFSFQTQSRTVPNIIGKNLHEAVISASAKQLSVRLLREKEDSMLPEGTIIQQIPKPYQTVRLNQSIFVTVSKKPPPLLAPEALEKKIHGISAALTKSGINSRVITFVGKNSCDMCVAQSPRPAEDVGNKKMTLYVSAGTNHWHIMPMLKETPLNDVVTLLKKPNITVEVFDTNGFLIPPDSFGQLVIDQKPMAGSIVNLDKPLNVQLLVG